MKINCLSLLLILCCPLSGMLHGQTGQNELSDQEKIFGLSKVWKEVDKNFVFFDQVPELDWEATYQSFIPKVLATKTHYEYYKTLQQFCSMLQDGHTRVVVPYLLREQYEVSPPLTTARIDGKVYVTAILNDTIARQGLRAGMEILQIDGMEVTAYADRHIAPYAFYSTPQDKEVQIYDYHLLDGPLDRPVTISVAGGREFVLDRRLRKAVPEKPVFEFELLADSIGYLTIHRFWGEGLVEQFDSLYRVILNTSRLVIDVAANQGGSNGYANYVLSHFVEKPFRTSRWKTPMYLPAYASWGYSGQWQDNEGDLIDPNQEVERYTKPLVVVISEKTYSAGEDFVAAFTTTKRGPIVGRPTAGTTGNPIGFALPGGGGCQICTKRDYLPDGREFVGYGIQPDVFVPVSTDETHLRRAALRELR